MKWLKNSSFAKKQIELKQNKNALPSQNTKTISFQCLLGIVVIYLFIYLEKPHKYFNGYRILNSYHNVNMIVIV